MLYLLDTDHISLLQHNHANVIARLKSVPITQRVVCVISLYEQLQGRLAYIHRAKAEADAAFGFRQLIEAIEFYRVLPIFAYSHAAVSEFKRLRQQKIRIGTQDLRIAAIALSHRATVVTRNLRDFGQVPGLMMVDWSQPE